MKAAQHSRTLLALVVLLSCQLFGQAPNKAPASSANSSAANPWTFSLTAEGYIVPHDRSYVAPIVKADHKWQHVEARYNYEDQETGSLWVGYNLSFGHKLTLEATPMVGGVFGNTTGAAPGYEATLTYRRVELYSEGEYVFDTRGRTGSFFYVWSEGAYSPADWFRVGLVVQRTKAYHTDLNTQRGLLIGLSHKKINFTTYIFNVGWTDPTLVLSLGVNF
jgi:hypothetical protein